MDQRRGPSREPRQPEILVIIADDVAFYKYKEEEEEERFCLCLVERVVLWSRCDGSRWRQMQWI